MSKNHALRMNHALRIALALTLVLSLVPAPGLAYAVDGDDANRELLVDTLADDAFMEAGLENPVATDEAAEDQGNDDSPTDGVTEVVEQPLAPTDYALASLEDAPAQEGVEPQEDEEPREDASSQQGETVAEDEATQDDEAASPTEGEGAQAEEATPAEDNEAEQDDEAASPTEGEETKSEEAAPTDKDEAAQAEGTTSDKKDEPTDEEAAQPVADLPQESPWALLVQGEDGQLRILACDEHGVPVADANHLLAQTLETLFIDSSVHVLVAGLTVELPVNEGVAEVALGSLSPTRLCFLGSSLETLGEGAFEGWETLEEVQGLESQTSLVEIPARCFAGCVSLQSLTLPPSVVSVAEDAFEGCDLLGDIAAPIDAQTLELESMATSATPGWLRLRGADAYGTMQKIVQADGLFATKRGGTVIVATGMGYWDALAAAGLAGLRDAPVLITPSTSLAPETKAELQRLAPKQVLVMGGSAAVSDAVVRQIRALCKNTTRVAGATAADTALKIYEAGRGSWGSTAIVATCNGYWDALSIAPYAYAKGAPIFLTTYSSSSDGRVLPEAAVSAIRDGGFSRIVIVGGKTAVSSAVEGQLSGITVVRLAGAVALDTSAKIATWEVQDEGMGIDHLTIATSNGYWDALTGAALAGKQNSVLVLVGPNGDYRALDAVYDYASGSIGYGRLLGGNAALPQSVWDRVTSPFRLDGIRRSRSSMHVGDSATLTASVSGDVSGATYAWSWSLAGTDSKWTGKGSTLTMTPRQLGTYRVSLTLTDRAGRSQGASTSVTVWQLADASVRIEVDGWTIQATDAAASADGYEYRFLWKQSENGKTRVLQDWSSSTTAKLRTSDVGSKAGTYVVKVEERSGKTVTGSVSRQFAYDPGKGTVSDLLKVASADIGYSVDSDPQTGSKYGRWYEANVNKGRLPWDFGADGVSYCVMAVSYWMNAAGVKCVGFPWKGCEGVYYACLDAGRVVQPADIQPGMLILFDWDDDGSPDHIGICEKRINDRTFQTIEGNTSRGVVGSQDDGGWVARRTRDISTVQCGLVPYYP